MDRDEDKCQKYVGLLDSLMVPKSRSVATIETDDVEELIRRVTSSKWRRSAVDARTAEDIALKISSAVNSKRSIEFSVPFGGYKGWRLPSHPLPDWAEVFCLHYLHSYFTNIAEIYRYGVDAYFSYCSGVMPFVSNMPEAWQVEYLTRFSEMLAHFSTEEVRFHLADITQEYQTAQSLHEELESNLARIARDWRSPGNDENRNKRVASATRNFVIDGATDLTGLDDIRILEKLEESAMRCEALDSLMLRRRFNKYGSKIQLVFVRGPSYSLHVGSTPTSANHFWVGAGVIECRRKVLRPRILSATALDARLANGAITQIETAEVASSYGLSFLSSCFVSGDDG